MGRVSRRRFSIGEALNAPFGLLKRRPVTIFVWGLLRFTLAAGVLAVLAPVFIQVMGSAETGVEPDLSQFMALEAGVQGLNLLSLVLGVVIFTAAIRATLAKRGDGFGFLRLGMDELRVAVTSIAVGVGVYLGVIVLALAGLAFAAAISGQGEQVVIPVMVAYGGLVALLAIWVLARVILIIPVSVLDKTFAFERGWALGRGQAAKLAVTGFLAWVIQILIQLVFFAFAGGVLFAVAHSAGVVWPDFGTATPTLAQITELARPLAIPAAVLAVPAILLTGFSSALFSAPLASAARQLSESGTPPPSTVADPHDDGLSPIVVPAAAAATIAAEPAHADPDAEHGHSDHGHAHAAHGEEDRADPPEAHHETGHPSDEHHHDVSPGHDHHDDQGHAAVDTHGHDGDDHKAEGHDEHLHDDHGHAKPGDGH